MKRKILEKKKELINNINKTSARIKALEKIERVKTKTGSDFKNLSKNFKNIDFNKPTYITTYNKRELYILYDWKRNDIYTGMHREYERIYLPDVKEIIIDETTANEIEKGIKDLIESQTRYLKQCEKALSIYDEVMDQFETDIKQVFQNMKQVDKDNDLDRKFYYIATDIVHNCYF